MTNDIRPFLTTADDISLALAAVQQQLADCPRHKNAKKVNLTNFDTALSESIRGDLGNETQREWLAGRRKYKDSNSLLYIGMMTYATLASIPGEWVDIRLLVALLGTIPTGAVTYTHYAIEQNEKERNAFCRRPENQEIVSEAYAIMSSENNFRSLDARQKYLKAQYLALKAATHLPGDLENIVSDIAQAAANKNAEEFEPIFKPHAALLDNARFRNRLIIACAERGGLEFLFEQAPQTRLPVLQSETIAFVGQTLLP